MNPTYILVALGGGILIVGGLAVGRGLVPAEQTAAERLLGEKAGQTAGGTGGTGGTPAPTFTNAVTHTTDPELERRRATYAQLLSAYTQDLRVAQSEYDSAVSRQQALEREAAPICEAYAQTPVWGCDSEGFMGQSNRCYIKGERRDPQSYDACMAFVRGFGTVAPTRALEFRESFSLAGSWRDRQAETQHQAMGAEINQAFNQAARLRDLYAEQEAFKQAALPRINDLRKKIADLNAQGVF